jgi:putative restriction endonuclease
VAGSRTTDGGILRPIVRAADPDDLLRANAFAFLQKLVLTNGGVVSYKELESFEFEGRRIPLIQRMRGIRVVSGLEAALSILTTYRLKPEDRPYEDDIGADGYPRYKWRGTEAEAYDNVALRRAMELGKPLIWFVGVEAGIYEPKFPVWLVAEEPIENQFVIALDEIARGQWQPDAFMTPPDLALRREYALRLVRQRLHQPMFRRRVLAAYGGKCAICRLRHWELLDAAHIKEDSEGGEPVVPNGIAMCSIHHRAFDSLVIGVRPDYVVEVRGDVLAERDGPTLLHALQGVHRSELVIPTRRAARPDRYLLEARYERFRTSA